MNKLLAVFWDVDGTIADTELCGHRVAFNLAFNDYDLDWYWSESKYIELLKISGGLNRIIHYCNEIGSEISNNYCSKIQSRKRYHYKLLVESGKIQARYGVLRLINELANSDIEQFIVTTSGRDSIEPFLQTALNKHRNCFSRIITYEDVVNHKPHPDAYNLATELSEKAHSNIIVIEDSKIGVEAAKSAKLNCLLTLPTWLSDNHNISKKANACVDTLGDFNVTTKLIYGKPLINNYVDLSYLTTIIN